APRAVVSVLGCPPSTRSSLGSPPAVPPGATRVGRGWATGGTRLVPSVGAAARRIAPFRATPSGLLGCRVAGSRATRRPSPRPSPHFGHVAAPHSGHEGT